MILHSKFNVQDLFNSSIINKQYKNYTAYLSTLDLAEETIDWRLKHIRGFLHYIDTHTFSFKELKPDDIYNYLFSINNLRARTKEHRAICIRKFLNWLYKNKEINFTGEKILPKIKCNKNETRISYYTISEINKLINLVDKNNPNEKRDYSILLLCVIYGMRSKDIINLKFTNIDWNDNKLNYVSSKNKYPMSVKMPLVLRYALIDYIKNERVNSELNYIFLKDKNTPINNHTLYDIINKKFTKAKINTQGKRHGSHSLRHSLAVALIENNKSLYEVASILGHLNVNDAKYYAKVNLKELKKISLEVPEWKN